MKLLLAEDEVQLSRALAAVLRHHGYTVDAVYDGREALDYLETEAYDGIILDWMMPQLDGIQVLRRLREQGMATPVLLLTAKSEVADRVAGLDAGADDYLPKPFSMKELLARIRALTRRRGGYTDSTLRLGDLLLDRSNFVLSGPKGSVTLSSKEFQMMELLFSEKGRLISTERFMERVWGYDSEAELSVVWVYVSNLRKKLASLGSHVEIHASRGRGYSLEVTAS